MKKPPKLDLSTFTHLGLVIGTGLLFFFTRKSPLLGSLGFESADLFVGIFGPFFCLAAALQQKQKTNGYHIILIKELVWLLAIVLLYATLLFINGLTIKSCSLGAGALPFLVILLPALVLNISIGALIAALIPQQSLKFLFVIVGYGAYCSWLAFSWWLEPSFRLLSHLSVIITSDLLQGDHLTPPVLGFRAATLLLALAIIVFGSSFLNSAQPKVFSKTTRRPFMSLGLISLILMAQITLHFNSLKSLGKDRVALVKDYRLLTEKNGVKIFADPEKVSIQQAKAMLNEALFYQAHLKNSLGEISSQPITIWMHLTNEDKFLYTGAQNVHFALPKHREIHISGIETPHPVLGHELAHIYIGEHSDTLLGIPGPHYLLMNFALSEGLAMMLTRELNIDDGLSMLEQAQALFHADIRMNIDDLFGSNLSFTLLNPRAAYIYAGAFLEFLVSDVPKSSRASMLVSLIKAGNLQGIEQKKLHEKTKQFNQFLASAIAPYKKLWAEDTFKTKSILLNDCSDATKAEKNLIKRSLLNQDIQGVTGATKHLHKDEQHHLLDQAIDHMLQAGFFEFAYQLILFKESLPIKDRSEKTPSFLLTKLDCLINLERFDEALGIAHKLEEQSFDDATQRFILIERMLLSSYVHSSHTDTLSKTALLFLMAKPSNQMMRQMSFAYALGRMGQEPNSHAHLMAQYIYARLLMRLVYFNDALTLINALSAKKEQLPPMIERELVLMSALCHYSLHHDQEALAIYQELIATSHKPGEKLFIESQLERIHFRLKNNN